MTAFNLFQDPIQLKNLTRKFGNFKAVDEFTVSIKENEVFCLLGHNGSGKTTLLNMITGILKPSSGNATIYGANLLDEIDTVRQSLGLCQQFDVVFDVLTVREHLELTCDLKNVPQ